MKLEILPVSRENMAVLGRIHRCAFKEDFERYCVFHDYQESIERMSYLGTICYIVKADGEIAGDIVLRILRGKSAEIEVLAVLPEYQNRHIGRVALQFIEYSHSEVKNWELITPSYNRKVCGFYEKNGYVKISDFNRPSGLLMNIYQKKVIAGCPAFGTWQGGGAVIEEKVHNVSQTVII